MYVPKTVKDQNVALDLFNKCVSKIGLSYSKIYPHPVEQMDFYLEWGPHFIFHVPPDRSSEMPRALGTRKEGDARQDAQQRSLAIVARGKPI